MRTNIELDDQLIRRALQVSRLKTKKDVVHAALSYYIVALQRKELLSLRGRGTWEGDLDKMRDL